MARPTIVFVPGSWHTPEIYKDTIKHLHGTDKIYAAVGVPLASVGADPAHPDFNGDVQGIRDCLTRLVEGEEKDVVLVLHSYSGMPGSEACFNLSRKHRLSKGLKGGVVRVIFIAAYILDAPVCPVPKGTKFPDWMKVDEEKGIVTIDAEEAKSVLYNDLPQDEASKWAAKLESESVGVYSSTMTYAAWRDIPSTCIVGEKDNTALSREIIEHMVQAARKVEPSAFDIFEICEDGGHCLMLSQPAWLAGVIQKSIS